jgi:lycopene cyclase domain-containing protein
MAYTIGAVVGVLLALAVDWFVLRTRLVARKVFWVSYAIVLFFQLVVNGILTGLRIVRYDSDVIIGWRIAWAPVEDILFGFALITSTLSVWVWLGRRAAVVR